MTDGQKTQIQELRKKGVGYTRISKILDLSVNTVRSYCRRNGLMMEELRAETETVDEQKLHYCKCCGVPVEQNPGRKTKLFCSDECRLKWWNSHPDMVNRKAVYEFTCLHCKKPFTAYGNSKRKYCCNACYVADRFGGGSDEE